MRYLLGFARFWYDFVVGDDWGIAAAVVIALAALLALAPSGARAWWLLPLVVVLVLGFSLWRATAGGGPAGSPDIAPTSTDPASDPA